MRTHNWLEKGSRLKILLFIVAATCFAGLAENSRLGVDFFTGTAPILSPLTPLDPTSAMKALQTEEARIDPLFIDQLAERQTLWLRVLVAKGAREPSVISTIDAVDRWSHTAIPLRNRIADIRTLESALRSTPSDTRLRTAVARYWISEMELERAQIPSDRWDHFQIDRKTGNWECIGCYASRGPSEARSAAFPKAARVIEDGLRLAPNDPGVLFEAAMLWRLTIDGRPGVEGPRSIALAKQASTLTGPYAAVARVYVLVRDNTVSQLLQQAGMYRGKQVIGSRLIRPGYDLHGKPDPTKALYAPVFRQPSAQELAAADGFTRKANALASQERAELDEALRSNPYQVDVFRALASRPFNIGGDWERQRMERERILRYAILLDPTDWRLHLARAANWNALNAHGLEQASSNAQAVLRKNRNGNFIYLYDQTYDYLTGDAFTRYAFALEAVRRDPVNPFAHQRLAMALKDLIGRTISRTPILPDASQQAITEVKLTAILAKRHLNHPEDWRDAKTPEYTKQLLGWTARQIASFPAR